MRYALIALVIAPECGCEIEKLLTNRIIPMHRINLSWCVRIEQVCRRVHSGLHVGRNGSPVQTIQYSSHVLMGQVVISVACGWSIEDSKPTCSTEEEGGLFSIGGYQLPCGVGLCSSLERCIMRFPISLGECATHSWSGLGTCE
jgi:hypothetical protein